MNRIRSLSLIKLRYLPVLVITAVLPGLWLAREQLAELLVQSALHSYGLADPAADVLRMGLSHSHVAYLGFTLTTDTGRYRFDIENADIDYNLGRLAEGRVDNLAAESVRVAFSRTSASTETQRMPAEAPEPVTVIAGLRRAVRDYAVFDRFSVKRLILSGESFGELQHRPLRLDATSNGSEIQAELTVLDPERIERTDNLSQLRLKRLSSSRLVVELGLSAQPDVRPAAIALDISDASIEGTYTIEPLSLNRWLQPLADLAFLAGSARIDGTLTVDLDTGGYIESRLTAACSKIEMANYKARDMAVNLLFKAPQEIPVRSFTLQQESTVTADNVSTGNLSLPKIRLRAGGELSVADNTWRYNGSLSTERQVLKYASYTLPIANIATQVSADAETVAITGRFSPANLPGRFDLALRHRLTRQSGTLTITPLDPINLDSKDHSLSRLLADWPYAFDLLAGSIELSANGAWSRTHEPRLAAMIKVDDGGGNFGAVVFSGLSTVQELELLPQLRSTRSSEIVVKHLDSGVIASNISTALSLSTSNSGPLPELVARDLRGDIFGGTFSGDNIVFDLNRRSNHFEIAATDIDLARIVETQQLEDIEVTGRVDGTIPVEIDDNGISIRHGAFVSKVRAGTIRYRPAAGSEQLKQNPLTGIALDALRDFQYSHLSADVNYTPEGTLTISLKLKGTSPELDTKRPVHLNINTEQNLLSLLKSLRYAEGISAKIDKKVRRQYDSSSSKKPAE